MDGGGATIENPDVSQISLENGSSLFMAELNLPDCYLVGVGQSKRNATQSLIERLNKKIGESADFFEKNLFFETSDR